MVDIAKKLINLLKDDEKSKKLIKSNIKMYKDKKFLFKDNILCDSHYFEKIYSTPYHNTQYDNPHRFQTKHDNEKDIHYSISKPSFEYSLFAVINICDNINPILMNNEKDLFYDLNIHENHYFPSYSNPEILQFKKVHDYIPHLIWSIIKNNLFSQRGKFERNTFEDIDNYNNVHNPKYPLSAVFDVMAPDYLYFGEEDYGLKRGIGNTIIRSTQIMSLKIHSKEKQNLAYFKKLANSLIFLNNYYNHELLCVEFRPSSNFPVLMRNWNDNSFIIPNEIYDDNLLLYYQEALSLRNPAFSYLSFYHCLEHYIFMKFDKFTRKDIKDIISDIDLVESVKIDKLSEIAKRGRMDDRNKLKLILEKYLSEEVWNTLKNNLENCGLSRQIDEAIPFINNTSNLMSDENSHEEVIQSLSSRIYDIRNSIVHSKQTEHDNKFIPFNEEHEKRLSAELILIRLLIENIILDNGKSLE